MYSRKSDRREDFVLKNIGNNLPITIRSNGDISAFDPPTSKKMKGREI